MHRKFTAVFFFILKELQNVCLIYRRYCILLLMTMYYRYKCTCKCIDNLRLFFILKDLQNVFFLIYRRYCLLLFMIMYYRNKCKCRDNLRVFFILKALKNVCLIYRRYHRCFRTGPPPPPSRYSTPVLSRSFSKINFL